MPGALAIHAKANNPIHAENSETSIHKQRRRFLHRDRILPEFWNQANGLYRLQIAV